MSRSCPSPRKCLSESSSSVELSDFAETMQDSSIPECEAFAKSSTAGDTPTSSEAKSATPTESDPGNSDEGVDARARALVARIDDFRQSYNRTHGQVCEFFERARVVQKLGMLESSQATQLAGVSGDEGEEDECNSNVDCNYADGQKTTGMKRKLRKWRKVMRSALTEICPDLGLDNQPDINPGLMKHILDEVRNLKSQLAVQHSNMIQLARNSEKFRVDSEHKEQFIADLLQNCKGIRLDSAGPEGESEDVAADREFNFATRNITMSLPPAAEDVQFGHSKELIDTLKLEMETLAGAGRDDLVMDPVDFGNAQKQLHLLAKQTHGATGEAVRKPGGSSSQTFLNGMDTVRHREPLSFDIQPHVTTAREYPTTEPTVNSTPVHYTDTSAARIPSRASTCVAPPGRPFLVNLGASLTAAVVGGLVVNSVNNRKRMWQHHEALSMHRSAPVNKRRDSRRRFHGHHVQSSFMDGVKKFFDDIAFENWAPRSSRTWRLNLPPKESPTNSSQDESEKAKLWESLEEQIEKSRSQELSEPTSIEEESEKMQQSDPSSFSESTDQEMTDALNERILEITEGDEYKPPQTPLTGKELRSLIFSKYKRTYDIAFARRDFWGKPIVSLNIMWSYLEQSSFPMTETQLVEKYERFAIYLNSWEKSDRVREFLKLPPKSKGGLPKRPIMGIAVSVQLDMQEHLIHEWFDKI